MRRRKWKLKHLDRQIDDDASSAGEDYEDFLQDLEEDETIRQVREGVLGDVMWHHMAWRDLVFAWRLVIWLRLVLSQSKQSLKPIFMLQFFDFLIFQGVNIFVDKEKLNRQIEGGAEDDDGAPEISLAEMMEDLEIDDDPMGEEGQDLE